MAIIESPLSRSLQGGLIQRTVASGNVFSSGLRLNPVSSGPDFQTLAQTSQNSSDIVLLKTQIGDLKLQVESLVRQNTQLVTDVGQIFTVRGQVNALQNQVNGINSTITSIVNKPDTSNDQLLRFEADIIETKNANIQLTRQVDNLREQNRQIIIGVTNNISQIQQQVNGLQEQITDFSSAYDRIATLIANSSLIDQQKSQFENEQERRNAEIGLRRGKEKALENRIQEALTEPIKRLGSKLQFGLGNLLQALYFIFGGWLTNQVLNLLNAYSDKNWKIFDQIKESIIRNTLIAIRGLTLVKGGFFKLIGGIFDLAKMIGKFLIVNPIKMIFQGARNLLTGGKGTKAAVEGTEAAGKLGLRVAGEGAEAVTKKGAGKFLGRFIPGLQQVLGAGSAVMNVMEGDLTGAALDVGSMLPGPFGYGFLAAGLAYETVGPGAKLAEERSKGSSPKELKDKREREKQDIIPQQTTIPSISPTTPSPKPPEFLAQPQTPMMQQTPSVVSTPASIGGSTTPIQTTPQVVSSTPLTPSMISFGVDTSNQFKAFEDTKTNIMPAQTQTMPPKPAPGPEPPAKPNIVYTQTGTSSPQTPTGPEPTRGTSVSEVPFIPSSDPDNFYTLYSQIHYNVVTV